MRDFYIQRKKYEGWGTGTHTERKILYSLWDTDRSIIGSLGRSCWYITSPPFDVMVKLKVKPV
jgi:hypothetical protein